MALAYVPIRYLEIIISVDMDNIKTFTLYPKNTQVLGRFKLVLTPIVLTGVKWQKQKSFL